MSDISTEVLTSLKQISERLSTLEKEIFSTHSTAGLIPNATLVESELFLHKDKENEPGPNWA